MDDTRDLIEAKAFEQSGQEYSLSGGRLRLILTNPSIRACVLFHLCATPGIFRVMYRNALIWLHSCDVSIGADIQGPIYLPHPLNIVIGQGATVESGVTIYQGVTLGAGRGGMYPTIREGATIYTNSVIVGAAEIPPGVRIRACSLISNSHDAT